MADVLSTSLLVPPVMYGSKSLHQLHSSKDIENHCRVLRLVSRATLRGFVRCQNISAGHISAIESSSFARVLGTARIILVAQFQIEAGCADWPLGIGGDNECSEEKKCLL